MSHATRATAHILCPYQIKRKYHPPARAEFRSRSPVGRGWAEFATDPRTKRFFYNTWESFVSYSVTSAAQPCRTIGSGDPRTDRAGTESLIPVARPPVA